MQEGRGHDGSYRPEPNHRVPPHERDWIEHDRPHRFYDPGHHYYGYRVHHLPPHHEIRHHWGHQYFFCDGVYYSCVGGVYYVCRPPYGYHFDPALYYYEPLLCRVAYYSYVNHQYNIVNNNYGTIAEQNAIIARNNATIASQQATIAEQQAAIARQQALQSRLASESYQLALRLGLVQSYAAVGTEYYYDDGVFFVLNASGRYETIVPPAGALVEQLPDDYEIVTLADGKEYFKVDDTIYRMTVSDGKAYFEVLGQLQR